MPQKPRLKKEAENKVNVDQILNDFKEDLFKDPLINVYFLF